jgi:type I restriction enzyme, S subunit
MSKSEWRIVRLDDLAQIVSGLTLGGPPSKEPTSKVPYLRVANVKDGWLMLDDVKEIEATEADIERFKLRDGDVVLTEGGDPDKLGRGTVWRCEIEGCLHQNHIFRVRFDPSLVCPEFAAFQFASKYGKAYFFGHAKRTTGIASINKGVLSRFPFCTPPLREQESIAESLRTRIAIVEAANHDVKIQRQALDDIITAWIRDAIQDPATTLHRVEDVMEEVTQGVGSRWAEFPVFGATRSGLAPAKEKVGKTPGRYKPVLPGSIFYNPMRIMIGSIAMVDEGDAPGITSPDYVVVRPRTDAVHPLWFYEWLRSTAGARFIQTLARGGVRERMLFNRLKTGEMPVPPREWQERFAELSRLRRRAVALIDDQLEALDALPGAYLREAFGSL